MLSEVVMVATLLSLGKNGDTVVVVAVVVRRMALSSRWLMVKAPANEAEHAAMAATVVVVNRMMQK